MKEELPNRFCEEQIGTYGTVPGCTTETVHRLRGKGRLVSHPPYDF